MRAPRAQRDVSNDGVGFSQWMLRCMARGGGAARPRMTRKQVYIDPRQNRLLKDRARRYRVTEADLIRQAIDRGLERTATRAPDIEAWKRIERFIGRRRSQRVHSAKRTWTRAELYDR